MPERPALADNPSRMAAKMAQGIGVRLVCFDLGGVLVQVGRTWREVVEFAGVRATRGKGLDSPLDACPGFAAYQKGVLDERTYFSHLALYLGLEPASAAKRTHECILMDPYPGVVELVDALHAGGYRTGCLSNTNALHWGVLRCPERNPAISRLQTAVASHLVLEEKPHTGIFRAFEKEAGVRGEAILFFDDHPKNVEGARAAGWRAHTIDPAGDTANQIRGFLAAEGIQI